MYITGLVVSSSDVCSPVKEHSITFMLSHAFSPLIFKTVPVRLTISNFSSVILEQLTRLNTKLEFCFVVGFCIKTVSVPLAGNIVKLLGCPN